MARPPLPKNEVKGHRLWVRLTKPEYDAVQAAAKRASLSVSEWVRTALLKASERKR